MRRICGLLGLGFLLAACVTVAAAKEDEGVAAPSANDGSASSSSSSSGNGSPGDGSSVDADAAPSSSGLPPMVMPAFIVGYNEAWFGMKFGTDLTTDFDLAYVTKIFDGIVRGGGHVVRLFLFNLLQGIMLGPTTSLPQTQSISPAMLANLTKVLEVARARGLWVYLTALEGNQLSKVPTTKDYYKNLLSNVAGEGTAFETNVLAPLLKVLDAHQDNVFGLDLVNEIDAPRNDGMWPDPLNGPRDYIKRTTAFIKSKSPWIRVTATLGSGGTAQLTLASGYLSGLGLDFYDLHIYSDSGTYSGASDVCSRATSDGVPIYLGEFGQKTERIDDTLQYNATAAFLSTAKSLCFKGALAWRYDAAENWWAYVRQDGSFRPAVAIMQAFGK